MKLDSCNAARALVVVLIGGAMAVAATSATAADEFKLALKSSCFACHRGADKLIGPSFVDVAKKYAAQADAEAVIADHILKGTGPAGLGWMRDGKATLAFMPANERLTPQEAARLAKWIRETRGEVFDPSKFVTTRVAVVGAVQHPLSLSVEDLKALPTQRIGETSIVCQSGATMSKMAAGKGVLLRDVLQKAGLAVRANNDERKMAIIATASDDYKAVFSWAEIFNSPIGDSVYVYYERDGMPLPDDEGRIAMISTKDIRTGPRQVNWLSSIEVRKIAD